MKSIFCCSSLVASILCIATVPVYAQEQLPPKNDYEPPPSEECLAQPNKQPAPSSQGLIKPGDEQSRENEARQLDKCKGVLKPPPVGDPELIEPTPDAGKTPVIPPDKVPAQPPD